MGVKKGQARHQVTATDIRSWQLKAQEGRSRASIAKETGFDARTVVAHLRRAEGSESFAEVMRGLLSSAMEAHHRDLLATAVQMKARLTLPPAPVGLKSGEKLVKALLAHNTGTGLPAAVVRWEATAQGYAKHDLLLRQRLGEQVARAGIPEEGADQRLRQDADDLIRRAPPTPHEYRVVDRVLVRGTTRFVSGVDSLQDPRAVEVRGIVEGIWDRLADWEEVSTLTTLCDRAKQLQFRLHDMLEDVLLRKWFSGECKWCPGTAPRLGSPRARTSTATPGGR